MLVEKPWCAVVRVYYHLSWEDPRQIPPTYELHDLGWYRYERWAAICAWGYAWHVRWKAWCMRARAHVHWDVLLCPNGSRDLGLELRPRG